MEVFFERFTTCFSKNSNIGPNTTLVKKLETLPKQRNTDYAFVFIGSGFLIRSTCPLCRFDDEAAPDSCIINSSVEIKIRYGLIMYQVKTVIWQPWRRYVHDV